VMTSEQTSDRIPGQIGTGKRGAVLFRSYQGGEPWPNQQ
jgi:hypothetical protein